MTTYIAAFVIAGVVSVILTPLARIYGLRVGAVANPGGRNVHSRQIPRVGGLAIFVAFFAPLVTLFFAQSAVAAVFREHLVRGAGLLAGGLIMAMVGWRDDTKRVRALHKLYAQVVAAIVAFACGFQVLAVKLPLVGEVSMGVFALPVTVVWIVGIINAINLVDGLDGLAAGVVFFAGLTNFLVAYVTDAVFPALLMASMLGAVLGFLIYNFNPARIFMGDSGSYFLGFVLATTGLVGSVQKTSTAVSILVPMVALGLPIFDTLFSIVRRFLERRPIFSPDRGHLHHRLLDMGLTQRRAVLTLYLVSIVLTIAAVGISLGRSWSAGVAMLVASVVLVGLVRFVGYFEYLHIVGRQKARIRSRNVELLRHLLPEVPALFDSAADERSVWRALQRIQTRANISCVELVEMTDTVKGATLHAWVCGDVKDPTHPDLVSARFPVGREEYCTCAVIFRWQSDSGDVSPQSEVLLQVIVDVLARALARVHSAHAARVPEPAAAPLSAVPISYPTMHPGPGE